MIQFFLIVKQIGNLVRTGFDFLNPRNTFELQVLNDFKCFMHCAINFSRLAWFAGFSSDRRAHIFPPEAKFGELGDWISG